MTWRMRAAVLRATGAPLTIEEVSVPVLGRGQVLVRMQLAAVCHSQKLEVSGARGPDRFLPHLIGHEGVGIVEEVGPGVAKVQPGEQVILSWIRGSGTAADPIQYQSSQGPVHAGPVAVFCEMPVVSEQCVTRLHPAIKPEAAVLAGCALPTGAGTILSMSPTDPQGAVCIIGAGGVGLAAVCGAVLAGWPMIVAVDLRVARLERAKALGATHVIPAGAEPFERAARELTRGAGFDVVVECAGARSSMEAAVRLAKPCGGRTVIVGNLPMGETIQVNPFDLIAGRSLWGSWGGNVAPDTDLPRMARWAQEGRVPSSLLLGDRFPLTAVNEALASLDSEEPGRPVLDCAAPIPQRSAASSAREMAPA